MITGLYAVAAVLISFGAVIGKITPFQLLVMTVLELIFYSLNNQVFMISFFDIADIGGTIVIHEFGAFFGLAVSFVYGLPNEADKILQGVSSTHIVTRPITKTFFPYQSLPYDY